MFSQVQWSRKHVLAGLALIVVLALLIALKLYLLDIVLTYAVFLVVATAPVVLAAVMLRLVLG